MVGVCGASSCHFAFDVRRQRKASGDGFDWKLCKFVPHDALCGKLRAPTAGAEPAKKPRVVKRKERRCAYSSADLGRFLLEHQQTSKTSFTLATAKALLAPVVWMVSTNELAQRASAAATELMQGTPAYNHKMLPWLIDALKALGYHAGLVELTATEMDAILLARAKHDHHQAQKKFPKSKRSDFDASAVVEGKAVVAKAVPGSRFYGGWYAFCPTAKKMLEAGVLRKLFQADFCGAKGRGKGSFGVLMAGDAGSHHVFVGATHSIINESELAWDGLIKPAKEFLGSLIDGADVGIVADADKGGAASIAKVCPQSKKLVCMVHRGETAAKGDTEGASLRYKACVLATTDEMQRRALGKLTPKGLAFVNKLPFGVQFMLQNPGIFYGKPTSKQVESANWALMEMRRCATPGAALKTFLEYGEEQYLKHSAEAVATRTHTTAAVILELAKLEADAPVLCSRLVWVNEFAGKGRVYSRLKTGLYFDVNLGAAAVTCSCGVPRVNTKLCAHIAFGCGKFRRSLEECVFIDDTAVRFRQQYAAGGTWPVPHFDVDEEDLPENHLAMPLANPAPRGRPKTLRGKRGINAAVKEAAKRMRLQTKTTILDLTVSDDDDEQDDDDAFIDDDRGDDEEESDEEGSDDDEAEEGDSEAEEGDSEAEEDGDDDDDAAEVTHPRGPSWDPRGHAWAARRTPSRAV